MMPHPKPLRKSNATKLRDLHPKFDTLHICSMPALTKGPAILRLLVLGAPFSPRARDQQTRWAYLTARSGTVRLLVAVLRQDTHVSRARCEELHTIGGPSLTAHLSYALTFASTTSNGWLRR